MLHVRGIGPRHARLLFEHLGVQNIEQLELAARAGLLATVPGIGPLTVERALKDLDARRLAPPPSLTLASALKVGAVLTAWMLEHTDTLKATQTGSARRRKATAGDLDILCATTSPQQASAHFCNIPGVTDVLIGGEDRASILLDITVDGVAYRGVQADLRLVKNDNWGAGLHHFTGSKAHNIALRLRANKHKLTVSEMGIWERKLVGRGQGEENRKIARLIHACPDERDVFATLGLPFIPPELREGEGEVDAALAGKLPTLVDHADLIGEPHLVADTLDDARATVVPMMQRGLRWAIWLHPAHTLEHDDARRRHRSHAQRLCDLGIDVLTGAIVDVDDHGALTASAAMLDDVDIVCARLTETSTAHAVRALDSGRAHIVMGLEHVEDVDLHRVLKSCAKHNVAVHVCGAELTHTAIRTACETGALLAISGRPSANTNDDDNANQREHALWQARRGWATAAHCINAADAKAIRSRFALSTRAPVAVDDTDDDVVDPLFLPERREELMTRLSAFLRGDGDDKELRRALERRGGNALQQAFALLAQSEADPD